MSFIQYYFSCTQDGSIFVNEEFYSANEYCLEVDEAKIGEDTSDHQWNILICHGLSKYYPMIFLICEHSLHSISSAVFPIFLFLVLASTTSIYSIILLLYAFINELKNLHGKCVIGLLFSLIIATILSRFGFFFEVMSIIALLFVFLWLNIMIFDVWWILRHANARTRINKLIQNLF